MSKIDISRIAKLANIPLDDENKNKLEEQLLETIYYIESLQEINTDGKEPTNQVTGLKNIFREDIISKSFSQEESLRNSSCTEKGMFKVKAILSSD
ncbi:MAG: Asp-tRNA(Asn)/Glu-tRNA(Gln) amidotransferase subunit GatC [Candidatus Levybacteria bacterium]|nr:Asp-tRNA(Asn)/Glu-tRNA(Gln) amidotransferase subunit GatC [Candidatus Levybacteria bacterium]